MGEAACGGEGKPLSCVSGGAAESGSGGGNVELIVGMIDVGRFKKCILFGNTWTPPKRFCGCAFVG